jgi:BirA family transcriptional regulator, biotin operon repressor / biotin---[acetyl-CoA-carboxylase] ligase
MTSLPLLEELAPLLRTARFGRVAEGYAEIDSTNRRALAWAEDGAPEGALVVAEHQSAGRGRLGRSWDDAPGLDLLLSLVLHPTIPPERLGLITLAAGLAVADVVATITAPVEPALKWPNDVLVEGRKACGMLLESRLSSSHRAVVLGIGLNVNRLDFPDEITQRSTSLRLVTGHVVPRASLLASLLERLEARYGQLASGQDGAVRDAFLARLSGLGGPVVVRPSGGHPLSGRLEGIDDGGALLLRTASGEVATLHAGEVTLRPEPSEAR